MSGIVIALGGNALGKTVQQQRESVAHAAEMIADLAQQGKPLMIVHGNGPQVGMLRSAMMDASKRGILPSDMPLNECVAMSQGYIGYHLQEAINNALKKRDLEIDTVTMVTRILVDEDDPAFQHPTKPIGRFYTREEAMELEKNDGRYMEDAGRGWRKVVPSPKPMQIIEKKALQAMMDAGMIAICCGGGGIPVLLRDGKFVPTEAVIDKDFAAAKLAEAIHAERLIILTGVNGVYVDFGTEHARMLKRISVSEALRYCADGQFSAGSMLPKIQAAIQFAQVGGCTTITSLERAWESLDGKTGTTIVPD